MQHYRQDLLSQSTGLPLLGVSVTVYLTGTTTKPTLYQANDTGGATYANPKSWDRVFEAYIPDGRYDIIAGGVTLTDVSIYDVGPLSDTVGPLPTIWPLLEDTNVAYPTTALMAATAPAAGTRAAVYNDAGTWPGVSDGYLFPSKGVYLRQGSYWNWQRSLEQGRNDCYFDAVFSLNEAKGQSNIGAALRTIGQLQQGTIDSSGSGVPGVWKVWNVTNVDGGDILDVRQNGASRYQLSGFYTEFVIVAASSRAMRLRATATGYSYYSGTDTVSFEPAQISTIGWNDPAHMGPADGQSVLEQVYSCGLGGRLITQIMGAYSLIARRYEREVPADLPVQKVQESFYKAASDSGVTYQIGNSGQGSQEGQYAGRNVANPILDVAGFQGNNGPWLQTWGTDSAQFAWVKIDGLARFTSVELPEGTPANPAADNLRLYARDLNGRTVAAYRNSVGVETLLLNSTIATSATTVSHTGDTIETLLATITIPANAIGPTGQVEIEPLITSNATAGTKTLRVYFGGSSVFSGSPNSTSLALQTHIRVANLTAGSQKTFNNGLAGYGNSTTAVVASSVDTTAAVNILITGQLSNGSDTMALESYLVRVTYGA